jgi:hypothetical protein
VRDLLADANDHFSDVERRAADLKKAEPAALKQLYALATPAWRSQLAKALALPGVHAAEVLKAMISAGSDSTPGDMVMAAGVYAVAATEGLPIARDIAAGRIKIDMLPGKAPPAETAKYSPTARGTKGDTIYVYSDLDVSDLDDRSIVIHELEHAETDKNAPAGQVSFVRHDDEEARAYGTQASYQLRKIAARSGDAHDTAVRQVGSKLDEKAMLALILEHHRVREHQLATRYELIIVELNAAAPSQIRRTTTDLAATMGESEADLTQELKVQIQHDYRLLDHQGNEIPEQKQAPVEGLSGESALDWADKPRAH